MYSKMPKRHFCRTQIIYTNTMNFNDSRLWAASCKSEQEKITQQENTFLGI